MEKLRSGRVHSFKTRKQHRTLVGHARVATAQGTANLFEPLEERRFLTVALNSAGWIVVTPVLRFPHRVRQFIHRQR